MGNRTRRLLVTGAVFFTVVACGQSQTPDTPPGPDEPPLADSTLCRSPLGLDGDLQFSEGLGLYVWYYECRKSFSPPDCAQGYNLTPANYVDEALGGGTNYSGGGFRLSYECSGPMSATLGIAPVCADGLSSAGISGDVVNKYVCALELDSPYCHLNFRNQIAQFSGSNYTFEGGNGGNFSLSYLCSHWKVNDNTPPEWPPNQ